ncbi:immunoglobulin superfamily member 1-like [Heteronotia binoei]|uniref:immunoglobulin superfamily member 1-like n=1 Tax=Heteronotia binoei TaxID=13085 RepID=UPI0029316500|nr:immunoglobulin superfamily member 1-like [Heteronotia binoei]
MMPVFFMVCCWLLSRSEGKGFDSEILRPPSIRVNTSRGILLGGTATILCHSPLQLGMHFYLEKDGQNITADPQVDGGVATFSIYNVSREHGRMYACYYYDKNQQRSEHSESVELLVIDPDLPRPNISLSPGKMAFPSSNITIQCWIKGLNNTFYLHNAGGPITSVVPARDMAVFHISNVSLDHGGNYSCSYQVQSDFFISSDTSDTMELLVFGNKFQRHPKDS